MANYKPVQNMSNLYEKFRAMLGPSYTPQSASTLKDTISRAVRGGYDKQIRARQDATKSNTGEIVAGMGSSGMGTSTTMQDRLLRAKDAEARDIANIESDYQANVNNMLLNRLNSQDEFTLSAENNLRNSALGLAQGMYGKVFGNHGPGGGGWGGRGSRDPKDPGEPKWDPILDNASNNQRAIDARKAQAQQNAQNASNARAASAARRSLVASSNNLNKKVKNRLSGQPVNRM